MTKNKKAKKRREDKKQKNQYPVLTSRLKRWIGAIGIMLVAVIIIFSFLEKAGGGGRIIFESFHFLIGQATFFTPFILFVCGILILKPQKKRIIAPTLWALLLLVIGISGVLNIKDPAQKDGGWLGYIVSWPFFTYLGSMVAVIIFSAVILVGVLIFWEFMPRKKPLFKKGTLEEGKEEKKEGRVEEVKEEKKPKFKIKPLLFPQRKEQEAKPEPVAIKAPAVLPKEFGGKYQRPPVDLLDTKEEKPSSGDTAYYAAVIQKTLQNFGIEVEMSEINVGPTVTQYTLKPAEGVKLSKITSLNNDLALALASHPIRVEAPIPGRSLVGIEMPNKIRAKVKVGSLISLTDFQNYPSPLCLALGRDVMGSPIYPNLGGMPHLLVAGSTGSGKTICLNSLILSLIYRNSPKILRLILIDPKRVEFPVYKELPHLLTPVLYSAPKAVNALNWLVGEMERRFEVLREFGTRDILSYNKALQEKPKRRDEGFETMPYIILIIDELADLMAAKGREVEAGIVRLSQLARAVGIHLIVATQRPSVEVITGLIKANITSRIAFQVASQVDSRTILDVSGAEKLLGKGDMLFISSEFSKPKRIQGSFITPQEIKRVVRFIEKENVPETQGEIVEDLGREMENWMEDKETAKEGGFEEEPLYDEAKKVVMEYRKASASLLQRRLKIGYARAARIIDILEENGVVGPQDGARPREVYLKDDQEEDDFQDASGIKFEYK